MTSSGSTTAIIRTTPLTSMCPVAPLESAPTFSNLGMEGTSWLVASLHLIDHRLLLLLLLLLLCVCMCVCVCVCVCVCACACVCVCVPIAMHHESTTAILPTSSPSLCNMFSYIFNAYLLNREGKNRRRLACNRRQCVDLSIRRLHFACAINVCTKEVLFFFQFQLLRTMFFRTFSSSTKENKKESDVTTTSKKKNKDTTITTTNKNKKLSVGGGGWVEGVGGCWLFYRYSDLLLPLSGNGLFTCASKHCGKSPKYD